ncbi:hypothetical protein R1flu_000624 [Riccia fluitans]|uniref:Uncharacterized protein n=1 Tax=Riccia fluitans TaxID=41844 RepID=A0ABD1Y538_9MARC
MEGQREKEGSPEESPEQKDKEENGNASMELEVTEDQFTTFDEAEKALSRLVSSRDQEEALRLSCVNGSRLDGAEGRKYYHPEGEGPQQDERIEGAGTKSLTGNEAETMAPGKVLPVRTS